MKKYDKAIVCGYFNPLHMGHLNYLQKASEMADSLVVIVNNDKQVEVKGTLPFMSQFERMNIVRSLKMVDGAWISIDYTGSVVETLKMLANVYGKTNRIVFCVGGDHNRLNTPEETALCKQLGIDIKYGVGGSKIQSSSELLGNVRE